MQKCICKVHCQVLNVVTQRNRQSGACGRNSTRATHAHAVQKRRGVQRCWIGFCLEQAQRSMLLLIITLLKHGEGSLTPRSERLV